MTEKKVTVPLPTGGFGEGFEVTVDESLDRWSEVTLEDGTKLRVKANVLSAIRLKDVWDQEGNPTYVVKSNATISLLSSPEVLRKKKVQ